MPKSRKRPAAAQKKAATERARHAHGHETKQFHAHLDAALARRMQIRRIVTGMRLASLRRDRLRQMMMFARANNDPDLDPKVDQGYDSMEVLIDRYEATLPHWNRLIASYPTVDPDDLNALVNTGPAPMDTHQPWFGAVIAEDHLIRQVQAAFGPAGKGWTHARAIKHLTASGLPDSEQAAQLLALLLVETAITSGWKVQDMKRAQVPAREYPDAFDTPLLENVADQGWEPAQVLRAATCLAVTLPALESDNPDSSTNSTASR